MPQGHPMPLPSRSHQSCIVSFAVAGRPMFPAR
ncbi:hypothetical protein G647_06232 [Cladophialophora carrionii CBS 160.54]|uniref:Uncharacterized protein n=1 Tax=Cladophialophora carrionii CBS 160.54 TaxID=1279043 RepID=V9D5I1_9EURO|nr:uncharacterized protein G647_06232 [Cladophialophora carrionii CBS 160.54]ETI22159.1 hypothetical protein G647_06232 [Cladophialophora carrionii CBS 160.54]